MIKNLPSILKRPRKILGRRWMTHASAVVILRKSKVHGFDILLIKRAERSDDPWSGDMAFLGGKMASTDQSIYHIALH
ncbi:MAG: hypothetical protein ACJAS1_005204 [Oleiphilaceae bacterium]|jgi:hypothetical protein